MNRKNRFNGTKPIVLFYCTTSKTNTKSRCNGNTKMNEVIDKSIVSKYIGMWFCFIKQRQKKRNHVATAIQNIFGWCQNAENSKKKHGQNKKKK